MPPASRRWRRVLRLFDDLAERYGYELIMTPVFEATELFSRAVGESTDVVQKQMYTWDDKAGRSMTLRPEATAPVVRAYLNAGGRGVAKYAYSGPMFRYEQPQAGRRRQFWQIGVEYVGEDSPTADVEVIELGYHFYVAAGISDISVQLNSIGDAESRAAYREILVEYLEARRDRLSEDSQRRLSTNPLRVLDSKADVAEVADAPSPVDHLSAASAAHFEGVTDGLTQRGIPFVAAPRLVRGLDYYTRTVFEYTAASYGAAQDSLGGGGRYDGLAQQLGGSEVPGVGFSLGIDRVVLALGNAAEPAALDVFVVAANKEDHPNAQSLLALLRANEMRADGLARVASVKAQLKAADRSGAAQVVTVDDTYEDGTVTVRSIADRKEDVVEIDKVVAWLSK